MLTFYEVINTKGIWKPKEFFEYKYIIIGFELILKTLKQKLIKENYNYLIHTQY